MKAEQLMDAFNFIDDDLIEAAEAAKNSNKTSKHRLTPWFTAAACLGLIAASAFITMQRSPAGPDWAVKEIHISSESASNEEIAVIPHWEDMSVSEQFCWLEFGRLTYSSRVTELPPEQAEEELGEAALRGTDEYTGTTHQSNALIYTISGISSDCAVAVKFREYDNYFVYVNSWYQPETLGEFIDDLNLTDTLTSGSVWYDWKKPSGEYATVEFTGLETSVLWDMLLSDRTLAAAENYDFMVFHSILSVSINVPLLGYKNISLSVTEEGWLTTNILDTGKAFFIGEEAVQQFADYVLEHCEGHEIVYVDDGTAIPE